MKFLNRDRLSYFLCGTLLFCYLCFPYIDPSSLSWSFNLMKPGGRVDLFQGITMLSVVVLGLVYCLISLFGYSFVRLITRNVKTSLTLKLSASFVIGYVLSAGILRIVTFIAPLNLFTLPAIITIVVLTVYLIKIGPEFRAPEKNYAAYGKELIIALLFAVSLSLVLIINVQVGGHMWTGHGEGHYAFFLSKLQNTDITRYFPVVTQHYSETLFNYFLYSVKGVRIEPVIIFWVTNSLVKVSTAALIYILFRWLGVGRVLSAISVCFFAAGTMSLDPRKYFILFDSANPLIMTLHPDRVAGAIVAIMLMVYLIKKEYSEDKYRAINAILFGLLGLSLPAGPIHNVLVFGSIFFMVILFSALKKFTLGKSFLICIACLTLSPFLAYTYRTSVPGAILLIGFAAAAALFAALIRSIWMSRVEWKNNIFKSKKLKLFGIFAASSVVSVLFFGNVFVDKHPLSMDLNAIGKDDCEKSICYAGEELFGNAAYVPKTSAVELFKNVKSGEYNEIHKRQSQYDRGGFFFIAYYGLVYLAALYGMFLLNGTRKNGGSDKEESLQNTRWLMSLAYMLAIWPLFFFYVDFVSDLDPWIKSRFFEFPYYIIMFVFFFTTWRYAGRNARFFVAVAAIVHIVMPIVCTGRDIQFVLNYNFLVGLLK